MSCSRPINDVDVTGREREPRRSLLDCGRRRTVGPAAGGREPLAQEQGEVVAHQAPELPRRAERAVRVGPLRLELVDHGRQPRFSVGRRCLDVQQPGDRVGQPELVLESRDVHARPDPAVPLPVQADEDVGLREVGPVQLARWVRSGAELEQHRREPQGRDGAGHRARARRRARPAWSSRRRADAGPGCGSRRCPAAPPSSIRLRAIHRRILCGALRAIAPRGDAGERERAGYVNAMRAANAAPTVRWS